MKNKTPSQINFVKLRMRLNILLSSMVFFLFTLSFSTMAQVQRGLPKPSDPIDLSKTSDLVIFVLLPALVIIFIFLWRRAIKKRKQNRNNEE